MPSPSFDRYLSYAEITDLLRAYEAEYPDLVTLESMGKSYEGRDIWLVTVTQTQTGLAHEKPAFWADGNIHASELSASTAVLNLLHKLVTRYPEDPKIKELLDTRALYLCPRLAPDGAEWSLETPPRMIRSSTRPYPYEDVDEYGIEKRDLDGDGRFLSMRLPDPNGGWKICEEEPRLLVRRGPTDRGGTYYRVLPEGLLTNWDGMTLRPRRQPEGLDFNRNFPNAWRLESEQRGAGPFPTSEPEIRALVEAIVARPNICGAVCFHTYSGVNLRPPGRGPDDSIPTEDLWVYQTIGKLGEDMTGYPGISVWHDFKYHPKEVITGVFDDWMYEHRGVYAWTTEIWSPMRQAGLKDFKYMDWFREHPVEDDIAMLKWSDEKLGGKGHYDWKPFDHPQLGPVEIGGWDVAYAFRNPPPDFLEAEVAPLGDWVIEQALMSPLLTLREARIEPLAQGARLRVAVQNVGWLPTQVTKMALEKKLARGVHATIERLGEPERDPVGDRGPAWLVSGHLHPELGQLVGRSHTPASGVWYAQATDDVAVFEWVVGEPGTYAVEVRHERAGVVRVELTV